MCTLLPCWHNNVCGECRKTLCRQAMLLPDGILCPMCRGPVTDFWSGETVFTMVPGTHTWKKTTSSALSKQVKEQDAFQDLLVNLLLDEKPRSLAVPSVSSPARMTSSSPSSMSHAETVAEGLAAEEEAQEGSDDIWEVVGHNNKENNQANRDTSTKAIPCHTGHARLPKISLGMLQRAAANECRSPPPLWARRLAVQCSSLNSSSHFHGDPMCCISINLAKMKLTDESMSILAPVLASHVAHMAVNSGQANPSISVDVSDNALGDKGVQCVCEMMGALFDVGLGYLKIFKAFKNQVGDQGAAFLASLIAMQTSAAGMLVREVHLSHNRITNHGASLLTGTAINTSYPALDGGFLRPLWLRLEQNLIANDFQPECKHCLATGSGRPGDRCTPFNCSCSGRVPPLHVPFLGCQRQW